MARLATAKNCLVRVASRLSRLLYLTKLGKHCPGSVKARENYIAEVESTGREARAFLNLAVSRRVASRRTASRSTGNAK